MSVWSSAVSDSVIMSRILVIFAIAILARYETEAVPVAVMKQYIAPLPGFIPVYIRPGDTPLEEINADLAEAFESYAMKHARLPVHEKLSNDIEEKKNFDGPAEKKAAINHRAPTAIETDPGIQAIQVVIQQEPQHIQKIPRT